MDMKGLDLNLLKVLDVLLAEKNITRTGQRIHLSQSATSGALARLRNHFQDPLLVQVSQRLLLTPLAESLILPVRELMVRAKNVAESTAAFTPATSTRRITMMCSDYVAAILMPRVVRLLQKHAPALTLDLLPFSNVPTERLARGDIDFLVLPRPLLLPDHPSMRLLRDDFACLAWAENPALEAPVTEEKFLELGHILVEFGEHRAESVDQAMLRRRGVHRRAEVIVPSFNIAPAMLVGTNRVVTMRRRMTAIYAERLPLRVFELPFALPVIEEHLQWQTYSDADPALKWMRKVFRNAAAQLHPRGAAPEGADGGPGGSPEATA